MNEYFGNVCELFVREWGSLLSPCDRFGQIKMKNLDPLKTNETKCRAEAIGTGPPVVTIRDRVVSWDTQNVFGMHILLQMSIAKRRFRKISATG